jgi:prepilin-type processing-associated H-X9-DG protein
MMVGERGTQGSKNGGIWMGISPSPITSSNVMSATDNNTTWRINGSSAYAFNSSHVGGVHFVFADGRVRFLSENINGGTYQNLGRKADGNVIGAY